MAAKRAAPKTEEPEAGATIVAVAPHDESIEGDHQLRLSRRDTHRDHSGRVHAHGMTRFFRAFCPLEGCPGEALISVDHILALAEDAL